MGAPGAETAIAVIMSTYAEEESWLRSSIESILGQSWKGLRFYILLDNPSNELHKRVIAEYAEKDARVSFAANEQNLGLVGSLNKLLSFVKEPYVARMDADDIAHPERLAKEMSFLREYDLDLVGVGSNLLFTDGREAPGRSFPLLAGEAMREVEGQANIIAHSGWLVKKCVYDELNGYRYVAHCEDYDFLLRALQHGFKLGRLDEELLTVRYNESGISIPYAFEQDAWATYLRRAFSRGELIDKIDVEAKSNELACVALAHRGSYAAARARMDDCASFLYERAWWKCVKGLASGITTNKAFRKLLLDAVRARVHIAAICRRSL